MKDSRRQVEILTSGCSEVISPEFLTEKVERSLKEKKPLRIKAGLDPSSPDIHLGHTVLLHKLRQFQDHGHRVILIIGDTTAAIGDPSGRTQTRPVLTTKEIRRNARTYQKQSFKILSAKKTETVYNSRWLARLGLTETMDLASRVTIRQLLERDDFDKRLKENRPISLMEVFYPLLQGYDSVRIRSDVELGGTDQKFNLLMGRDLQRLFGQEPQVVMTLPLLVGTDGVQKMSKSLGNHIGIMDPPGEIYGRIMSLSDDLMWHYYACLTQEDPDRLRSCVEKGELHPKALKEDLGELLVERFWTRKDATAARREFERVFSRHEEPSAVDVAELPRGGIPTAKLLLKLKLVGTGNEARRLIAQKAVKLNDKPILDPQGVVEVSGEIQTLKAGKRRYARFKGIA